MNWTSSWNYIAPLWAIQIKWVEQMLWRVKIEPTAKKRDAFGHTGHFVGGSQLWMFRSSRSMISTFNLTLTLVAIWLIPNLNSRGHHVPILQPGEALLPQRLPHPLLQPLQLHRLYLQIITDLPARTLCQLERSLTNGSGIFHFSLNSPQTGVIFNNGRVQFTPIPPIPIQAWSVSWLELRTCPVARVARVACAAPTSGDPPPWLSSQLVPQIKQKKLG